MSDAQRLPMANLKDSSAASCPICSGTRRELFQTQILGKHEVRYFLCDSCGFLQTETPYWLDEAYSRAIADADTGLVSRNLDIARKLSGLLYFCLDPHASYLEFAGGYGLLTRLMRDRGFEFSWHDRYCENMFARGFDWSPEAGTRVAGVTAFEVLEHVPDPFQFVRDALEQTQCNTILFTTLLYEGDPPAPGSWWYYAPESGQHISFYSRKTLESLATRLNLTLYTNGWFHILTDKKINTVAFRLLTGRTAAVFDFYVKRRLKSKTFEDHQKIRGGLS